MQKTARSSNDLGHILKQYRLRDELTQTELAKKTQSHQRLISRIESGNQGRTLHLLFKILKVLDLEKEIRPRQKTTAKDIADMFK